MDRFLLFLLCGVGIFLFVLFIVFLILLFVFVRDVPHYLERIAKALEKDDSDDEFDDL